MPLSGICLLGCHAPIRGGILPPRRRVIAPRRSFALRLFAPRRQPPVHNGSVQVLLVSTYEMGRQPFGLASPAAWLRAAGHDVTQADVSCTPMPSHAVETAG